MHAYYFEKKLCMHHKLKTAIQGKHRIIDRLKEYQALIRNNMLEKKKTPKIILALR
jgi:hypothetical protein